MNKMTSIGAVLSMLASSGMSFDFDDYPRRQISKRSTHTKTTLEGNAKRARNKRNKVSKRARKINRQSI